MRIFEISAADHAEFAQSVARGLYPLPNSAVLRNIATAVRLENMIGDGPAPGRWVARAYSGR